MSTAKKTTAESERARHTKSTATRIHQRQLFHWIGSHIETNLELNPEARRTEYVKCLRNSLDEAKGLWLNRPRDEDILLDGTQFRVTEPICCFTETSLEEVHDHANRYGKLGLGFPKRFVLNNGGRPVNYILDQQNDPTMQAWHRLAGCLLDDTYLETLKPKEREQVQRDFIFVSQFLKRIKQPRKILSTKGKKKIASKKKAPSKATNQKKRSFGGPLHYLEEREWRFVVQNSGKKIVPKGAIQNKKVGEPEWFLPYKAGDDLFTIVFPDNQTMALALRDTKINQAIFRQDRPHVTLLTLEDVGTF